MSHDRDQKRLGKLILAICFKAAKVGVPKDLDENKILSWINNPDALSHKMEGLLNFLHEEPEIDISDSVIQTEKTMTKIVPMRTADKYLSEFARSNVELDPFFTEDFLAGEIRPLGKSPFLAHLTAVCFGRKISSTEAEDTLQKLVGCKPASFSQLADTVLGVPGYVERLGLVVATGGKFTHNNNQLVPYATIRKEPHTQLKLGASHHDQLWPENCWFLGIS